MKRRVFIPYAAIGAVAAAFQIGRCSGILRNDDTGSAPIKSDSGQPFIVTDKCVLDGACLDVCPVDAICHGTVQYFIDPEVCISCGACEPACPVSAIWQANALPPALERFIDINANGCKKA